MNVLLSAALIAALCSSAWGQTAAGSISGAVHDPSDAAVPGAHLKLVNTATNEIRNATSSATGAYAFPLLAPAVYRMEVESSGFKRFVREEIKLDVALSLSIDVALQLGQSTEVVNVTASAPALETGSASLGHLIENKRIIDLPINGRNAYSFATLVPGIRASQGFRDVAYGMYNDQFISINGSRSNQSQFYLDGGANSTAGFNGPGLFPSVDVVEEYKVQTNNFSAEFGNTAGGVINVVTKAGTNQFHGSLFEFLRNDKLTANDFFVNRGGLEKAAFRFNQFGGTLGGPILIPKVYNGKDRTFFFVSYEGLRWVRGLTAAGTMPTELQRAGDFSQSRNQAGQIITLYDPVTASPDPQRAGRFVRTAFPGNVIPASRFDPVARNLLKYIPRANTPGARFTETNNFLSNFSAPIDKDTWSIRGDHAIKESRKIFFRYSANDTLNGRPDIYGTSLRVAAPTNGNDTLLQRQATLNYTGILRPTLVLELSSSYLRYYLFRKTGGVDFDPVQLGFPSYYHNIPLVPCFPTVGVTGLGVSINVTDVGGGFIGSCGNLGNSFDTFHESASLTNVRGAHTLKIGGSFGTNAWSARNFFVASNTYNFAPTFTQGPDPLTASNNAGTGFGSFLLGVGGGSIRSDGPGQNIRYKYTGAYFQDDWKVTRRLTLNLGVRYDYNAPWTDRFNRISSWDGGSASPLQVPGLNLRGGVSFPGVGGLSRGHYDSDYNNFAPRIGFALSVNPKTVIRGGFGIFFGPVNGGAFNGNATPRSGFDATTTWVGSVDGITPKNYLSNPYPDGFERAPGSSQGLATQLGQSVAVMDRGRRTAYAEQWNFNIQRTLPGNLLIDAAYAGSRGVKLYGPLNYNQLPNQFLAEGDNLRTLVTNPFFGKIATGILNTPTIQRGQLLRPYPQFDGVTAGNNSYGASTYHALQAKVERRFARGFSVLASYTFSKLLDDVLPTVGSGFPGEAFSAGALSDQYNRRNERAVASFDAPHYLTINTVWELPFGRNRALLNQGGPLAWVFGGWQLNGIAIFQSGAPLGFSTSSNTLRNNGGPQRPNWNGQTPTVEGPISDRLSRYFDTAVFSTPAPYAYGNLPRLFALVRGPGPANLDFSVFKNIPVTERFKLQFRAEAFNVLNHPLFGLPNTAIGAPAAGVISSQVNTPRDIQLALKLLF
jgi:hypothetical protein